MSPTVEVQIRRNRNGSVLAYADRDRATSVLEDHRAVLHTLYDLVDRRHGADGDVVARIVVAEDAEAVDDLDLSDRFRRDLNADRAISLVEDLRYHAGERKLVADGGGYRAECPECSWTGEGSTLSGAGREADEHRQETGHDAKVERDLATDGGEEVPPAENVLFDAIEEHYDDDQCGAPTDGVVRSMLAEQFIDVAEVGRVLQDCYFDGEIYQPSDTTIARTNPEVGHGDE